jgi:hypothetical protein
MELQLRLRLCGRRVGAKFLHSGRRKDTIDEMTLFMKTQINLLLWASTLSVLFCAPNLASAYYDPGVQRWINRDPGEEDAGVNLYAFVDDAPLNQLDHFGLRSCDAVCKEALTSPNVPLTQGGVPSEGGIVCDSDGKKYPCVFPFPVPGRSGEIYNPGDCPALDSILKKHEKGHMGQVHCPNPGRLCRAVYNPNVDQQKADCDLWKKDIPRLESALKHAKAPCASIIQAVLEQTRENYKQQCGGK